MDETRKMTELRWQAINNPHYLSIIGTGEKLQIAVISLKRGEETGLDVHRDSEELFVNVAGSGKIILDGIETDFAEHDWLLIRPGVRHNLINTGREPLKLIALFTPPHFPPHTKKRSNTKRKVAEVEALS